MAATKLLHPCLSLASLSMEPQLWFTFFISATNQVRLIKKNICAHVHAYTQTHTHMHTHTHTYTQIHTYAYKYTCKNCQSKNEHTQNTNHLTFFDMFRISSKLSVKLKKLQLSKFHFCWPNLLQYSVSSIFSRQNLLSVCM